MARRDTIGSHFREPKNIGKAGALETLLDETAPEAPLAVPPAPTKPITIEPEITSESFDIPIREKTPPDVEPEEPKQ